MSQKEMDVYANVALVGDHNCFMKLYILKEYMTGLQYCKVISLQLIKKKKKKMTKKITK